ncbi:Ataxin-10, partial [Porites harrisoni]
VVLLDLLQVKTTGLKFDIYLPIIIIKDALDEPLSDRSQGQSVAEQFYASSLNYVADQFENHAVNITERLQEMDTSSDDFFQDRTALLETCLGLLKETAQPGVKESFSNVSSVPQGVDSGRLSPSHGFQRDLVRVIGNMCYQHTANQNKVRELEGIPLLLDRCNVDDHNPCILLYFLLHLLIPC